MKIHLGYFFLKFGIILAIFAVLPFLYALLLATFLTWAYQYFVALVYGLKVMPTMDMICFYSDDTSKVNFMSTNFIEKHSLE